MRLFFFVTKSELGGAQTHIAQLVQYCVSLGDHVAVMSNPGGWLETETMRLGATFFPNTALGNTVNPFQLWTAHTQLLKATNAFKPTLITCHSTIAGLIGRLSIRNRIPTIFTAHGWGFTKGTSVLRRLLIPIIEKITARYCQNIICVSENDLQLALHYRIAPSQKLLRVYNGVPSCQTCTTSSDQFVRIIFVGRFAPPKDPLLLLKAIEACPKSIKQSIRLSLIGDGPLVQEVQQYIQEHHLVDSIYLLGSLTPPHVQQALQTSDIFILPSRYEGFPYVVLEAMACGLPVIASDVGGIREAIEQDAGLVIPPNDQQALTDAIVQLVQHPEERKNMGKIGRQKTQTIFSLETMCHNTHALYTKVINTTREL